MAASQPFDRYVARDSLVHRLDPRLKIVATLAFVISNLALADGAWWGFLASWCLVLVVALVSGLGVRFPVARSLVALPFAMVAVTVAFSMPGPELASFNLGPWRLTATEPGVMRFASILLRSWLSVQMALLLTATTRFPDLMHALHHLHVPGVLVATVAFMGRYLALIADEARRLMRARDARSAAASPDALAGMAEPAREHGASPEAASPEPGRSGGTLAWRAGVAGSMAGQLFTRSYDRSDRVYQAMLARGFSGHVLTMSPHRMRRLDWATLTVFALALGLVQALGIAMRP